MKTIPCLKVGIAMLCSATASLSFADAEKPGVAYSKAGDQATTVVTTPDMNSSKPPRSTWTGLYGGLNAGALVYGTDLHARHVAFVRNPIDMDLDYAGFIPGAHAGYLKQYDSGWVSGIEGDISYPIGSGTRYSRCGCGSYDRFKVESQIQGSLRARVGYTDNHWLPYFTAGIAFVNTTLRYHNDIHNRYARDDLLTGFVLGAGLEYALMDKLSLRAEYLYSGYIGELSMRMRRLQGVNDRYGKATISETDASTIRVGFSYFF